MTNHQKAAAYVGLGLCLAGIVAMHAIPAFLVGLLAFALTKALRPRIQTIFPQLSHGQGRIVAALATAATSIAIMTGLAAGIAFLLRGESIQDLMLTVATVLDELRRYLPAELAQHVPMRLMDLKSEAAATLKDHAATLAGFGTHALHSAVLLVVSWLVGIMAAIPQPTAGECPAFEAQWRGIWARLEQAFEQVAFAQIKISAINATLTGVFLLAVMPLMGWHLPYAKTLVLLTFIAGLLPVVGNLISNTLICAVALTVSPIAAGACLAYLVLAHKAEYLLNAKILGGETGTHAWELLIVLFVGQTLFGLAAMVAAPMLYAFLKAELKNAQWVAPA